MRGSSGSKAALITLIALAIVLVPNHLPSGVASGSLQPSTFYFHNQATKTLTAYTISLTSSSYQIEQGAILNFQITVTITGTTTRTISLPYDGAAWPSQVAATFQQRIGINFYSSFNQTGLQTSFFSRNWT